MFRVSSQKAADLCWFGSRHVKSSGTGAGTPGPGAAGQLGRAGSPGKPLTTSGQARLAALITRASHGHQGAERARQWLDAAQASLDLYAGHPAVDLTGLASQIATEVRLLRATCAELATHTAQRETCYQAVDPAALAPVAARARRVRRPRAGCLHRRPRPVPPRQAVPLLHRPGPAPMAQGLWLRVVPSSLADECLRGAD